MRMAGIEFEGVVGDITNKKHAPKGKVLPKSQGAVHFGTLLYSNCS